MPRRRKYSAEFKREAVALANQPGVTKAQVGRELDVNPNMITRWQREPSANGSKAFLGQGVARDFAADAPNAKWVTDITYVRIVGGIWLYLCVVIDLYSGLIVGWSMSRTQNRQLVLQAVLMALWQREARQPVILHSDRDCQFTSDEYQRFLTGPQRDLLDERRRQLRRQCRLRRLLRNAETRARQSSSIPVACRSQSRYL